MKTFGGNGTHEGNRMGALGPKGTERVPTGCYLVSGKALYSTVRNLNSVCRTQCAESLAAKKGHLDNVSGEMVSGSTPAINP